MLSARLTNILFITIVALAAITSVYFSVSAWVYIAIIFAYVSVQAYGSTVLSAQYFVPVKFRGERSSNAVAITFDDGPLPGKTDRILDILKRYNAPAAFFCIGKRVVEHPEIVKRITQEGHLISNHSYFHGKNFDLQSSGKILKELQQTDQAILSVTGSHPRFFRPPYGVTNPMVASAIRQGNYVTVGWSVRSFDTVIKDAGKLLKKVTSNLKAGDVVVFHDFSESTIAMLPAFLTHISTVGLKIVRVDELIQEQPYV